MKVASKQINDLFDDNREYDDNGDKIDKSKVIEISANDTMHKLIMITGINNKTIESAQSLGLTKDEIKSLWYKTCKGRNTRMLSEILTEVMVGDIDKDNVLRMIKED